MSTINLPTDKPSQNRPPALLAAPGSRLQLPAVASPVTPPPACPILGDTASIQALSQNFVKALRRLRRDLAHCKHCHSIEHCPVLANLNSTIQIAICQVLDEWQNE